MKNFLTIDNVSKTFKRHLTLNGVSLTLESNKIYGLLGRNGAGKTTLLSIISGQTKADKGSISIEGKTIYENDDLLSNICFVKDFIEPLAFYKIDTILRMAKKFFPNWNELLQHELVEKFGISLNQKYQNASKGQQAIVSIIIGLSSRAPLTLMDEPITGLDANAREIFYQELMADYQEYPRTFILSTHYIDEISNVIEEMILLHQGSIIQKENVADLLSCSFVLSGYDENVEFITKNKKVIDTERIGRTLICSVIGDISIEEQQYIIENRLSISTIPLQKLFIYLTKEKNDDK